MLACGGGMLARGGESLGVMHDAFVFHQPERPIRDDVQADNISYSLRPSSHQLHYADSRVILQLRDKDDDVA
jgi:hypothetical protein